MGERRKDRKGGENRSFANPLSSVRKRRRRRERGIKVVTAEHI